MDGTPLLSFYTIPASISGHKYSITARQRQDVPFSGRSTTEQGRRRLLALSSDVHTTANWTTKRVGVRVGVLILVLIQRAVRREIRSLLKGIGSSGEEIANTRTIDIGCFQTNGIIAKGMS